jgi:hypothetical protein
MRWQTMLPKSYAAFKRSLQAAECTVIRWKKCEALMIESLALSAAPDLHNQCDHEAYPTVK